MSANLHLAIMTRTQTGKTEILHEGDVFSGWRVVRIEHDRVTLEAAGRQLDIAVPRRAVH